MRIAFLHYLDSCHPVEVGFYDASYQRIILRIPAPQFFQVIGSYPDNQAEVFGLFHFFSVCFADKPCNAVIEPDFIPGF